MPPDTDSPPSTADRERDADIDLRSTAESGAESREHDPRVAVETRVPAEGVVHRCPYCDRPFAEASYLALHRGLAHADRVSQSEREAFEAAYEAERSDLRRFRLVALGLLVILYFGFLFTFAVVT